MRSITLVVLLLVASALADTSKF